MKNKIICLILIGMLCLTGCNLFSTSAKKAILKTDNPYFQTEVLIDNGDSFVIRNKITDEVFLGIEDAYGITLTPIKTLTYTVVERAR